MKPKSIKNLKPNTKTLEQCNIRIESGGSQARTLLVPRSSCIADSANKTIEKVLNNTSSLELIETPRNAPSYSDCPQRLKLHF